jgi:hypothetical protein
MSYTIVDADDRSRRKAAEMELYVHNKESDEPKLVVIEEEVRLEEIVVEHGEPVAGAWLEDADEELDIKLTIRELEIVEHSHIHLNTCKRIHVTVRQDTAKENGFPPSATIARVYEWASGHDGFNLPPAERVKHTLVISGTTTEPDKAAHVGSFANSECGVSFDLVPKERFEG